MGHWLSVIRFVPDPAKGEFINVAAVAGNDATEEVAVRAVSNWARAKRMDLQHTLAGVVDFVTGLQEIAELDQQMDLGKYGERLSREAVERMCSEMQNVVQIGRPMPVRAQSVNAALELAFSELIIDPEQRTFPFEKKHRAVGALKEAYKDLEIPTKRDAWVQSGVYKMGFDFAVANGQAVQLARCWSFQLPNQGDLAEDVKAWAWNVRAMRQGSGAQAAFKDSASLFVPNDVDIEAVYIPPSDTQESREAFDVALNAFADADTQIIAVPVDQTKNVARRAAGHLLHVSP